MRTFEIDHRGPNQNSEASRSGYRETKHQAEKFATEPGIPLRIEIIQAKYLNNIIEQDHRFIKRLTRQMKGFKSFGAASATLAGIEVAHMIRKGQFNATGKHAFQQFVALAA